MMRNSGRRKGIAGSMLLLAIAVAMAIAAKNAYSAGTTNATILYGWNGTEFVPVQVDASGAMKTTLNLSEAIAMNPQTDSLYGIGTSARRWLSGYFINLIVDGNLTLAGTLGLNVTDFGANGTVRFSRGNFTVDTTDNVLFVDSTNNRVGIRTLTPDNTLTLLGNEVSDSPFTTNAVLHINASDSFNNSITNIITLDRTLKSPENATGGIGLSILFRAMDNLSEMENIANITALLYNSTNGSELSAITFSTRSQDNGDNSSGHLTERMRLDGYGRFGINNTAPNQTLAVIGTLSINSGSGSQGLFQDSAGSVGIGTTAIDAGVRLKVFGDINITGTVWSGKTNITAGGTGGGTSGQWNSSGLNVFLNDSGYQIGLGTQSPEAKLQIRVNDTNNISTTNVLILEHITQTPLNSTGGIGIGVLFRSVDNGSNIDDVALINATLASSMNGSESSSLGFYTRTAGGALAPALFINGSRVGIGTTNPAQPLHVSGDTNITGSLFVAGENISVFKNVSTLYALNRSGNTFVPLSVGNDGALLISAVEEGGAVTLAAGATGADLTLSGALTVDSPTFYVDASNNRVGAGTLTPDNILTLLGNEIADSPFTANSVLHINASDNFNNSVTNVITLDRILKSPGNLTGAVGLSILFRAMDNLSQMESIANISAILYNTTNGSELSAITFSTRSQGNGDNSTGHLTERMRLDGYGRVGINITNPVNALEVGGHINVTGTSGNSTFSGNVRIMGTLYGASPLKVGNAINITTGTGEDALFVSNSAGEKIFRISETGKLNITTSAGNTSFDDGTLFVDVTNNMVGIGTLIPYNALTVVGSASVSGTLNASSINSTGNAYFAVNSGKVGIGTGSPTMTLHVVGSSNISQNLFVGGNITTGGADFAEMMYSDQTLEAGDVVCFYDGMKVGKCAKEADKSVAGVVSSNPTIIGNKNNGNYAVGIVGLIKTKVNAPVEKYDLLASSYGGYAKKATKEDFGAVIGKALEDCSKDECVINVLVGLS